MTRLRNLLLNRTTLSLLLAALVSAVVWFAGPLVAVAGRVPLAPVSTRWMVIAALFLAVGAGAILRYVQARRANRRVLDAMAGGASDPADSGIAEEREVLERGMLDALATLRERDFSGTGGSRWLYDLPWYAIIGPPGAGKTTLLANSGLHFPLEASHGKRAVKGVGGTRHCDWWFTDQAVLLDTAGRYTTQDSETEADRAAWQNFLGLLRETRPRQPLNGVLVALSVQDLLTEDDDELAAVAHAIRRRIDELYTVLGVAVPVYLLFTKCDLLPGFTEFFAKLDREEREQVWGYTLEAVETGELAREAEPALRALAARLYSKTPRRLQEELSLGHRERLYLFPMEFNAMRERALRFIEHLSIRTRLLEPVRFRGLYFSSATQTGSVLGRVIDRVSRSFGLDEDTAARHGSDGRSYFISRLLTEVVFPEAGLAGTNLRHERRIRRLQWGGGLAVMAVLVLLTGFWSGAWIVNTRALASVEQATGGLSRSLDALAGNSVDLLDTQRALDAAIDLRFDRAAPDVAESRLSRASGLHQGTLVDRYADAKYRELLIDALLPRLLVRLENQMQSRDDDPEFLFEALKTYLMLDDRDHYDPEAVIGWFRYDFDRNLPADVSTSRRTALTGHMERLFEERPRRLPRPLDRGLIAQYRLLAADVSIERRTYSRVRQRLQAEINRHLALSAVSPGVSNLFQRRDGVSLDRSIPTLYSLRGYRDAFLPASREVSANLADDRWVLGELAPASFATLSPDSLQSEVEALYHADYIEAWDTLIRQLELEGVEKLQEAARLVARLADTDSPLKALLLAIVAETRLTAAAAPAESGADPSAGASRLERLFEQGIAGAARPDTPIDPVSEHFASLHSLVDGWQAGTSTLDELLASLADLNRELLPMARNPAAAADPQLSGALALNVQSLANRGDRLPEPLASLVRDLTGDIDDTVGGGVCHQLELAWRNEVHAFYQRAIRNRYPVNRAGTADIAPADFAAFFGPGGQIDRFVNVHLTGLVTRAPDQWIWTGTGSASCLSDDTLRQLSLADDIRQAFFGLGGNLPSFGFDLLADALYVSDDIDRLLLDLGGRSLEFFHGPIVGTTAFVWPGERHSTATLEVQPVVPGSASRITTSGPWAALRLMDLGRVTRDGGGLSVTYTFGGRPVRLTFATGAFDPLYSAALRAFRVPEFL